MKYLEFLGSTTDTIIVITAFALIVFTYKGITDPKDFITFLSMVASYKFGRTLSSTPSNTTTTVTSSSQDTKPLDQLPG